MPDTELWRLYGVNRAVCATVREIRDSTQADSWHSNLIGPELRIEQGGEPFTSGRTWEGRHRHQSLTVQFKTAGVSATE